MGYWKQLQIRESTPAMKEKGPRPSFAPTPRLFLSLSSFSSHGVCLNPRSVLPNEPGYIANFLN